MKKIIAICPADDNNWEKFGKNLLNSLRKFHSEEELPFIRVNNPNPADKNWWYRSTPLLAKQYLEEYETVLKLDSDQLILAPISHIWGIDADVGVVLNDFAYPINVWDIGPQFGTPYFNNGLVVLKSKEFVNHWLRLCNSPHFDRYQFREQDILTILTSDYFSYKVDCLDLEDKIHGEWAKSLWPQAKLVDGKVIIPSPLGGDKQLLVIHFGGGNDPSKGNYRIRFNSEIVKYIDILIK